MRKSGFIILFCILLLTAGAVYWQKEKHASEVNQKKSEGLISEHLLKSATELRLSHSDEEIVFKRAEPGKDWKITSPFEVPLEKTTFEKVYGSIVELRSLNSVDVSKADRDAKAYGFHTGEFSFTLASADGNGESWLFGKKTNFSEKRYVIKDSDKVIHLVDDALAVNLMKRLSDFRDRSPLKFDPSAVSKIERRIGLENDILEKEGGHWFYKGLVDTVPIDTALIDSRLEKWRKLEAVEVIPGGKLNLSEYGLEPGLLSITLYQGEEDPLIVLFGEAVKADAEGTASKKYYFRTNREEGIFRTQLPSYRDFLQPLELLRDRSPFDELDREEADRVVVSIKGAGGKVEKVELNRTGSGWSRVQSGEDGLVKKDKIDSLLARFYDARLLTWIEENRFNDSKFNRDEARIQLEVFDRDKLIVGKIFYGKAVETKQVENIGNLAPPVYGAVQTQNGAIIPAVISSGEYEGLSSLVEAFE